MATNDSPKSITASRTLQVAKAGAPAMSSFTPMYKEDYATKTVGLTDPEWRYSAWTDERALSGTKSLKMGMPRGYLPPSCGGSHFFANNHRTNEALGLPATIPIGNTVWFRMYFYFASTFSFGYLYRNGNAQDDLDSTECGKSNDMGNTGNKWMNFDSPGTSGKVYIKIPSGRQKIAQPSGADPEHPYIRIENEAGNGGLTSSGRTVPLDQWFAMQLGVKVSNDNTGFVRLWLDNDLVAEQLNVSTIQAGDTYYDSWGLGDYWNGIPYTDGAAGRDDLYIDEIIIASDVAGYGTPTGIDANGNAYIDPATRAGDLS